MFKYLIKINPLGFLYGSSGPFLSPDNLVGRSGNNFPPSAATVSGLYAAKYSDKNNHSYNSEQDSIKEAENSENAPNNSKKPQLSLNLPNLIIAGPFWAKNDDLENFYVPTPLSYLVELKDPEELEDSSELLNNSNQLEDYQDDDNQEFISIEGEIKHKLTWNREQKQWLPYVAGKFANQTWIPIKEWSNPDTKKVRVLSNPWKHLPHLHPKLETGQRKVDQSLEKGSLFLENAVQMHPDTCLVYLTNTKIDDGWYRFGGEAHLIELECIEIKNEDLEKLLESPVEDYFALITPAIWGSNRFSHRLPMIKDESSNSEGKLKTPSEWENAQMITGRAKPFRYRLGGDKKTKRLSRGRYAVPAGTVYALEKPLSKPWLEWDESWFPQEGYSFMRWGCGLALPLPKPFGLK